MAIQTPKQSGPYHGREIDCLHALSEIFDHVLSTAERCGWFPKEAAKALEQLAAARVCIIESEGGSPSLPPPATATKH